MNLCQFLKVASILEPKRQDLLAAVQKAILEDELEAWMRQANLGERQWAFDTFSRLNDAAEQAGADDVAEECTMVASMADDAMTGRLHD